MKDDITRANGWYWVKVPSNPYWLMGYYRYGGTWKLFHDDNEVPFESGAVVSARLEHPSHIPSTRRIYDLYVRSDIGMGEVKEYIGKVLGIKWESYNGLHDGMHIFYDCSNFPRPTNIALDHFYEVREEII